MLPDGFFEKAGRIRKIQGYLHLNISTQTSEFCCDSIAHWWAQHGSEHNPDAKGLLVLCDRGGSNALNRHVFKEALQHLANRFGLEIRIATTRRVAPNTTRSSTDCLPM